MLIGAERPATGVRHGGAQNGVRLRADQRQQASLERALVKLRVEADREAADHVEQALQRQALRVEQQLVAGVEDPEIAEHLAFRGQERGVAAGARR
jgi:hypothetical protein